MYTVRRLTFWLLQSPLIYYSILSCYTFLCSIQKNTVINGDLLVRHCICAYLCLIFVTKHCRRQFLLKLFVSSIYE